MDSEGIFTPASRHVLLALTGGALVMLVAGGRVSDVAGRLRGQTLAERKPFSAETLAGWAILLPFLIFMADIPVTSQLAVAFSWLLFFLILTLYGPEAAAKIGGLLGMTGGDPTFDDATIRSGPRPTPI